SDLNTRRTRADTQISVVKRIAASDLQTAGKDSVGKWPGRSDCSVRQANFAHLGIDGFIRLARFRQTEQSLELADSRPCTGAYNAIQRNVLIAEGLQPGLNLEDPRIDARGRGNLLRRYFPTIAGSRQGHHRCRCRRGADLLKKRLVDSAARQADLLAIGVNRPLGRRSRNTVYGTRVEAELAKYPLHLQHYRIRLGRGRGRKRYRPRGGALDGYGRLRLIGNCVGKMHHRP